MRQADYSRARLRMRNASPQAWWRFRRTVTDRERRDIAKDIAEHLVRTTAIGVDLSDDIANALLFVPWEDFKQA